MYTKNGQYNLECTDDEVKEFEYSVQIVFVMLSTYIFRVQKYSIYRRTDRQIDRQKDRQTEWFVGI